MLHIAVKIFFMIAVLSSPTFAEIKTEDLGVLNLKNGLVGKLYKSSLTGSETYSERVDYLKNKIYLTDGELIAQRAITSFSSFRVKNKMNEMFGFYYDPDYSELILELRGYIKAPASGIPTIRTNLYVTRDCEDKYAYQSDTHYWVLNNGLYLNTTSDGNSICTYDTSARYEVSMSGGESTTDTNIGGAKYMNTLNWYKGQYYPIVFRSRISGDAFRNSWVITMDNKDYSLDYLMFYDLQDDYVANDANHYAQFPERCPQFHSESFADTTFVIPTSTVPNGCVTPTPSSSTTSSIVSSVITSSVESSTDSSIEVSSTVESSIKVSSSVVSSTKESNSLVSNSIASSSGELSSIVSSDLTFSSTESSGIVSKTVSQSSSALSSVISSSVISSSIYSSSDFPDITSSSFVVSGPIESSNPPSNSDKTVSTVTKSPYLGSTAHTGSSTSSANELQHSSKGISSSTSSSITISSHTTQDSTIEPSSIPTTSFSSTGIRTTRVNSESSTGEKVLIPAESTITSSKSTTLTSGSSSGILISSVKRPNSGNITSTATVTIPDVETLRTTTCPDSQILPSTTASNSQNPKSKPEKSRKTIESRLHGPATVLNVKTTTNSNGDRVTYTTVITSGPENDVYSAEIVSASASKNTGDQVVVAAQQPSSSAISSPSSYVQPYAVHSTTALIQPFSDAGHTSRYDTLLFILTLLISLV